MSMPSVHVHERVHAQYVSMSMSISVSPGIEPGYVVFPSHKNNVQFIVGRTATMWKNLKFLAVRRVFVWWPIASVLLTVRFQSRD
jgi:hypothetical protein